MREKVAVGRQNRLSTLSFLSSPASKVVGVERFELPTSCSQSRRATRLRYTPTDGKEYCREESYLATYRWSNHLSSRILISLLRKKIREILPLKITLALSQEREWARKYSMAIMSLVKSNLNLPRRLKTGKSQVISDPHSRSCS